MSETVCCPWCKGQGRVPLGERYAETMQLLRSCPEGLNGAELAKLAGIQPTAMNNRLYALEQMGLAVGEWNGRERLWAANREAG